ncbi:MAG TPA: hypothetical protein VGP68_20955 [Gemmataceae bacterium]|jgi:hypothetical protein|nr:hypothetical protein [Gemmataceae bacterium]
MNAGPFHLAILFIKLLASAGGGLLGGFCGGILIRAIWKLAFKKQASLDKVILARIIGCFGVGLAIWFAFGSGGWGMGSGSGGLGAGGDKIIGHDSGTEKESKQSDARSDQKSRSADGPDGVPTPRSARVEMLGGRRVEQDRFYVIDEKMPALTFAELRQLLMTRKNQEIDPIKAIEIVIYEDSVSKDHPAVRDLEQWANANGLQVAILFPPGNRS